MDAAERLKRIQEIEHGNPVEGFEWLRRDLLEELKRRGVNEAQLRGVDLVLQLGFRLGEKAAAAKIAKGFADDKLRVVPGGDAR